MASISTLQSAQSQPVSINSGIEDAKTNIKALKTFIEVSRAEKDLVKSAANSATEAKAQITSQLDKVKNLQKQI